VDPPYETKKKSNITYVNYTIGYSKSPKTFFMSIFLSVLNQRIG